MWVVGSSVVKKNLFIEKWLIKFIDRILLNMISKFRFMIEIDNRKLKVCCWRKLNMYSIFYWIFFIFYYKLVFLTFIKKCFVITKYIS